MLTHLKVSNVALIEEASIEFAPGLNILTGETGAGKSILIDSINFVLGGRPSKEFVRAGAEAASVEVFAAVSDPRLVTQIAEIGVEIAEDAALLISRTQTAAGKGTAKINGKPVTIGMLREISDLLVDVHGQHEHQSLLNSAKHIQLLDRFCQDGLQPHLLELAEHIAAYKQLQNSINSLSKSEFGNEKQIEMYNFQIAEIAEAELSDDEEDRLTARRKLLSGGEKVANAANAAASLLSGEDGALDALGAAIAHTADISALDNSQLATHEELTALYARLEGLSRDFGRYAEGLEHDPAELENIESRLDKLYRLKQKYGRTIPEMLAYAAHITQELETIRNSEEELARLAAVKKALEREIGRTCLEMSKIRRNAAKLLETRITTALHDLGMEAAQLNIQIHTQNAFGSRGFDRADFLFTANAGEAPKPLSAIASGGEMSRVMLALKTVLASFDSIETFIFDEIDTGVSGRTAQRVAQKLATVGRSHQILCITHLPQIAAMGDANFGIVKVAAGERTITQVERLDEQGVIDNLARLIGGAEITETTTRAAQEMRASCCSFKQNLS